MEMVLEFCKSEYSVLGIFAGNVILLIIFIVNTNSTNKLKKTYKTLIKRLGKSNNIEEMLDTYLEKVETVEEENKDIKLHYEELDKNVSKCIKKVGIVRYSAFKDMGSDLSFAVALLDDNNNGIVLNGIYSVENSNIYAKPIQNAKSKYTISQEEQEAINIALQK